MKPLRVVAIVANVKQYRAVFYEMLEASLKPFNVAFEVLYSNPDDVEATKGDSIDLPPPLGKRIPRLSFADHRALLQFPGVRNILGADLLIVVQAAGYLLNYPILLLSALGMKKVAYWGHGRNLQGNPASMSERMKRMLANSTDWWFAYTKETKRYLVSIGVAPEKITPIENAIDTRGFRATLESISDQEVASRKLALGLAPDARVGLYCGSLYREKRLDYLIAAAGIIGDILPSFRLVVVGAGPESEAIRRASEANNIVVYAGPVFGREKATYFRIAEVFLNPGLVGLGILDSFAAGLPFFTTSDARHSPEIAYLEPGINGESIQGDSREFAMTISSILCDANQLARLKRGALAAAAHYTVENMVENVRMGILQCLGIDRNRVPS